MQYHIGTSLFLNPQTIWGFSFYNKRTPSSLGVRFLYSLLSKSFTYCSYSSSVSLDTLSFFAIHPPLRVSMDAFPLFYSVRSAMTGSFFAAADAGMRPEISVNTTLMTTMMIADTGESEAIPPIPEREKMIALIGISNR